MKKEARLSKFEVAIAKGDAKLLKDLPFKLTLEDAVDSLFTLWFYLGCPNFRELYWVYTWWDHEFDRKSTAAKLKIDLETLHKRIQRLEELYNRSGCRLTLQNTVNGLFTLWQRLGSLELRELCWIYTWWDHEFDRKSTAAKLNIDLETLQKRIERLDEQYKQSEPDLPHLAPKEFMKRGTCLSDRNDEIEPSEEE
jgi:hypothetical protein